MYKEEDVAEIFVAAEEAISRTVVESKTHSVKVHIHLCCMGKTMGIRLMEEEFISSGGRRPNSNQVSPMSVFV